MAVQKINLHHLVFLVADPNPFIAKLIDGMLRGFGASKILEVANFESAMLTLAEEKIDLLLCDAMLPTSANKKPSRNGGDGGIALTRALRGSPDNPNRTIPILLITRDTRESTIKRARDSGANMVVAKPMSPKSLYERLTWIAFNPRKFINTPTYFGPDRRFKIEGYPNGVGRRKEDGPIEVAETIGAALTQNDIDSLFSTARKGQG